MMVMVDVELTPIPVPIFGTESPVDAKHLRIIVCVSTRQGDKPEQRYSVNVIANLF